MTYLSVPKRIEAFEFTKNVDLPEWFNHMLVTGRALVIRDENKETFVRLWNKRGEYKGFEGDWVCKDHYGHIFIVSKRTFHERYEKVNDV